ncbi:MAG: TolC family protein [Saprospiraceae bacterium]|nr:TolC family protein [Saprospiraceae bacterium]
MLYLFMLCGGSISAQEVLSLDEAIRLGLENNFAIRIARNNERVASNNNTQGNAGMLPIFRTTSTVSYTSNNTIQKFFSGDERSGTGAGNTNVRLGAELTWTAFDGFRMFAAKDRLELQEQRSYLFTQRSMQDLVSQIQTAYMQLIRIKQQTEIIEQSIELNQSLKTLAAEKLKLGATTELELLQTTNLLNADSSALLNLNNQLAQAKTGLNRLIGVNPDLSFDVPLQLPEEVLPAKDELMELAALQNYDLRLLQYDEQIALAQIKEARSALFPTVNFNAGFNYNYSKAEVGFLLSNRSFGPTIGISATYNIFPGRNIKKDIANVAIVKENIDFTKAQTELNMQADILQLYQQYQALVELQSLEIRNVETAERSTALARQLYQAGKATNFEVREAILAEIRVKDRLSDIYFRKKLAEIQLKATAGIPLY